MNHNTFGRATILVAHRDPLLSAGLVAALRQHVDFEVYARDAGLSPTAIPPGSVVVADYENAVRIAQGEGCDAERRLPASRVLALTPDAREASIRRAIQAGVQGYLLAGCPIGELVEAVVAVANGARYVCRSVAQRIAESMASTSLTPREIEVLQLVADGESNKSIARHLCIEVGTVKHHMGAIMSKLGASSRTHAAGIAAARGLVDERVERMTFA